MYKDLSDTLFQCAPGRWNIQMCQNCGTAFLDPRPTASSIGNAYLKYCTHPTGKARTSWNWQEKLRRLSKSIFNSYRNARWKTSLNPANTWGFYLVSLIPPLCSLLEQQMRHMPSQPLNRPGRLLDVGCGNGDFLKLAQSAGWEVKGIDFDPIAVAEAHRSGLDVVLGDLEKIKLDRKKYDWITCSHVLEHVHSPLELLKSLHQLLNEDGVLWLQVPNIESIGHEIYGQHWIGIDPPRHLSLPPELALRDALEKIGFFTEFHQLPILSAMAVYSSSESLRLGNENSISLPFSRSLRMRFLIPALKQRFKKRKSEFHTIIAKNKTNPHE